MGRLRRRYDRDSRPRTFSPAPSGCSGVKAKTMPWHPSMLSRCSRLGCPIWMLRRSGGISAVWFGIPAVAGHLTQSFPCRFSVQVLTRHYYRYCTTSGVWYTSDDTGRQLCRGWRCAGWLPPLARRTSAPLFNPPPPRAKYMPHLSTSVTVTRQLPSFSLVINSGFYFHCGTEAKYAWTAFGSS